MAADFVFDCALCGRRLPEKVARGAGPVLCAPCAAPRRPAGGADEVDDAEDEGAEGEAEDDEDGARPGRPGRRPRGVAGRRPGAARRGARSSERRAALRPSSESGATSSARGRLAVQPASGPSIDAQRQRGALAALVVLGVIALVYSLMFGRARHDSGYERLQRGMSRAQVVSLMGEPDFALNLGQIESLSYEDGGKRSHATYVVTLDQGKVVGRMRKTGSRTQFTRTEQGW